MKKILSILFVIVLVLSFSLIPAAPVAASCGPGMKSWCNTPGPVGEWHFDKVNTNRRTHVQTTEDSSGKGNTGTLMPLGSEPTLDSGKLGKALSFDGVDDYVEVPDSASLDIGTSDFSIEAWIKLGTTADDYYGIYDKGKGLTSGEGRYSLFMTPWDTLRLHIYGQSGGEQAYYDSTLTIDDTNWHYVAVFCDRDGDAIFAVDDSTETIDISGSSSYDVSSTYDVAIGVRQWDIGDHWFNGLIDEVRIWDTAHPPLHVDDDGAQYATPYTTITQAVAVAGDGDTICVHKGTYDETVTLNSTTASDISIIGQNKATTFVTGGICFAASYSGLKVQNLTITGNGYLLTETYEATISCHWSGHYPITNLEFSNCIFDGEGYNDGEGGRCGVVLKRLGGVVKFENNEFKNYRGWATLDVNDGSGGGPLTVTSYTFNNNNVHDNWGSCALRGDPADRTDTVNVTRNTFDNNGNSAADFWAALEINEADNVNVSNNTFTNTHAGSWGEGEAMQLWMVGKVDIDGNTIENNYMGIYILKWPATDTYDVSQISVHHNSFTGNENFALSVDDGLTGVPVDATNNWWGDASGPKQATTNPTATGDEVTDYVDYSPWLDASRRGKARDYNVKNIDTGEEFNWIQAAIDDGDTLGGHTILVSKGTYDESVTINKDNLTICGYGSRPAITGGLKFASGLTGLTFKNFYVTGNADPSKNSVVRMYGTITDLTIDNCVFDGENVADRHGFTGGQLEGDVTVTNSEFVDILGWAVFDSRSGSGGDGSAMGTVTFTNNKVHDCNGTVVFRGLSTDWTDNVYIYKNTFENIGVAGVSDHWAAFEVNRADNVEIHDNQIRNVVECSWGEGDAMQLWMVGKVDIDGNTIENNYMGIYILKWPATETYDVSNISVHHNSFTGNENFALFVEDGLTGVPVDAENNWWGDRSGPYHLTLNSDGKGDEVSDNVDFDPWLKRAISPWPLLPPKHKSWPPILHWPNWPQWPKHR